MKIKIGLNQRENRENEKGIGIIRRCFYCIQIIRKHSRGKSSVVYLRSNNRNYFSFVFLIVFNSHTLSHIGILHHIGNGFRDHI